MALKKLGIMWTIYFLLNVSELFCNVLTQEVAPSLLAEHVEYQTATVDDQPLIHAIESAPIEIGLQEQPIIAVHQLELNEVNEALQSTNEPPPIIAVHQLELNEVNEALQSTNEPPPIIAVHQLELNEVNEALKSTNEPPPIPAVHQSELNEVNEVLESTNEPSHAVNRDENGPVVANQLPDGVNQASNIHNHPQNVPDQVPISTNELPHTVNRDPSLLNPEVVNQPHRLDNPHKPSTVEFDFGTVESVEVNNEFENLPGVQHEFRIEVAAGKSECIFQRLAENAQLHVSFQVLRGLDRNIEFLIQGPGNLVLEHIQWSSDGSFQKTVPLEGLYRFCLNNRGSKFSSKLVYFYMVTYLEEKWHQHSKNILDFFGGAEDIRQSLDTVDDRVKKMHLEQANSRRNVITDWYLIQDNNSYIQTMSLILCVVIVVSSAFQVFFVRHLFSVKNVNAKVKARA